MAPHVMPEALPHIMPPNKREEQDFIEFVDIRLRAVVTATQQCHQEILDFAANNFTRESPCQAERVSPFKELLDYHKSNNDKTSNGIVTCAQVLAMPVPRESKVSVAATLSGFDDGHLTFTTPPEKVPLAPQKSQGFDGMPSYGNHSSLKELSRSNTGRGRRRRKQQTVYCGFDKAGSVPRACSATSLEPPASMQATASQRGNPEKDVASTSKDNQKDNSEEKKTLSISILSASGLRNADSFGGNSDPYCTIEIQDGNGPLAKTKVKSNTSNPQWNEDLILEGYVAGQTIVFKVWDKDNLKEDDYLGTAIVTSDLFLKPDGSDFFDLKLSEAGKGVDATLKVKINAQDRGARVASITSERVIQTDGAIATVLDGNDIEEEKLPKSRRNGERPVFPDPEQMKAVMHANLFMPEYDVVQLYHDTGWSQAVARHHWFEKTTLVVIVLNALWLSIDLDFNKSQTMLGSHPLFQVVENVFCTYFTSELMVRFAAFKQKRLSITDRWFFFDSCLVTLMVFETWMVTIILLIFSEAANNSNFQLSNMSVLRVMRLLRLTRIARLVKVMRVVPEIVVFFKGLTAASRAVAVTMAILFCMIYVFAIVLRSILDNTEAGDRHFKTVALSMYTLLIYGSLLDGLIDVLEVVNEESRLAGCIFVVYVFTATLTILNMLVGVLCNMVAMVATVEKETLDLAYIKNELEVAIKKVLALRTFEERKGCSPQLLDALMELDGNNALDLVEVEDTLVIDYANIRITEQEYTTILHDKGLTKSLAEVGIELEALVDFADVIFHTAQEKESEEDKMAGKGRTLPFEHFIKIIMQFRGQNKATVKDIVGMRNFLGMELEHVLEAMDNFEENVLEQIQWLLDHALKSGVRERTFESQNKQIVDLTNDSPRRPIADLHPSPPKEIVDLHPPNLNPPNGSTILMAKEQCEHNRVLTPQPYRAHSGVTATACSQPSDNPFHVPNGQVMMGRPTSSIRSLAACSSGMSGPRMSEPGTRMCV